MFGFKKKKCDNKLPNKCALKITVAMIVEKLELIKTKKENEIEQINNVIKILKNISNQDECINENTIRRVDLTPTSDMDLEKNNESNAWK